MKFHNIERFECPFCHQPVHIKRETKQAYHELPLCDGWITQFRGEYERQNWGEVLDAQETFATFFKTTTVILAMATLGLFLFRKPF